MHVVVEESSNRQEVAQKAELGGGSTNGGWWTRACARGVLVLAAEGKGRAREASPLRLRGC